MVFRMIQPGGNQYVYWDFNGVCLHEFNNVLFSFKINFATGAMVLFSLVSYDEVGFCPQVGYGSGVFFFSFSSGSAQLPALNHSLIVRTLHTTFLAYNVRRIYLGLLLQTLFLDLVRCCLECQCRF